MKTLEFSNGDKMPAIGLGTWKSAPGEVGKAVLDAIKAGYRHIDCAAIYQNEAEIGEALKEAFDSGLVSRSDLWITSKLWNDSHRKDQVPAAMEKTLKDLKLDYLDLYLMHWPVALKNGVLQPKSADDFLSLDEVPVEETWNAMEALVDKGQARHIGVSNFSENKLRKLTGCCRMRPEMNQVELHPYLQQRGLLDFCRNTGLFMTGYSPLGSKDRSNRKDDEPDLFELPELKEVAKKHDCTVAQVMIAWQVNRGTAVIPKSTNAERIQQNLEAGNIDLDNDDMEKIAKLDKGYRFIDGTFWEKEGNSYTVESLWND
ncbi:aldo/keto reductase [Roseivirga sp. BDSF3-8]|uniref:aldo/keto reductase n=1 Tax=Roseivirga sp. BDSF3-8 TaxID=3241598 RepID=UPI003531D9B6